MWITQLELRNVKSYSESTRIRFAPGVNAITGPNGAGKSTILEAIGFALFDAAPHAQRRFVREGAGKGEIVVSFVDAQDEREYQVVRPVGGGTPYVYDPEIRRRIVTGKQNVLDWLHEHLGVDPTARLKSLFDDAIGVPQGALTAPFLEKVKVRKAKFDPLLQVDDYEAAWEALRETVGYVRDQKEDLEKHIAGLHGRLESLPDLEQSADELRAHIKTDEEEQANIADYLAQVRKELGALDALKTRIGELTSGLKELEGQMGELARRLSDARDAVRQAQDAQKIVEQTEAGYQAYQAAQTRLVELEQKRQDRDKLREELSRIERDLALAVQAIENHQQVLADIARSEKRLDELKPLVAQQERVEAELQEAKKDVERWQEAQARLQEAQARLETLRTRLTQVRKDLELRRELEAEVESLSAQRRQVDEKTVELEAQLSGLEEALTRANADLNEARQAVWEWEQARQRLTEEEERLSRLQAELEQVRAGLQQRQQIETSLAELEQQREQREQERTALGKEEASLQAQRRMLNKRLGVLKQADQAACPVCQQPLSADRVDELADHYETELNGLNHRLKAIRRGMAGLEAALEELQRQIAQCKEQLAQLPSLSREVELSSEIAVQQKSVIEWQERVQSLAGAQERLQTQQERHREITEQREMLRAERRALSQKRDGFDHEIATVQTRIAGLSHPDRERELQDEIETQEGVVGKGQRRVESLSGAAERVITLQEQLASLGDPRSEQNRLLAEVEKRPHEETSLAEAQAKRAKLEACAAEVTTGLRAYANLDTTVAEQRAILNRCEDDHRRYLQNRQVAQTLPERQRKVTELEDEARRLESRREQTRRDLDAAQADYDEARHRDLAAEQQNLVQQEATLVERLRLNKSRLQQIEEQVAELHRLQDELAAAETERKTLTALHEALRFVRETIREAGPYVTRALVQTISAEADRIFGDILNDHTMRLCWGEDYGITIEQRGNEREFPQLSGGEKVVAALAVRLALLREMSAIRIAFFDEPTAHLDDERRENLAEQITQIKGFQQLFVISHDDTFERETHHVLRVSKEDGASRVEVG